MKKNILITGGSGFIGQNFKERFSSKYTIYSPTHQDLELTEEKQVEGFFKKNKIDAVIHCANIGGTRNTIQLSDIVSVNLRMFLNLLKSKRYYKKMIFLGSGAEYGKNQALVKVKESDFDKSVPVDDYGFYKYVCSRLIEREKNIVNLRLFGIYGKYEDYSLRFISNAIVKNLLLIPIDINQNVFFDYLYINDLIRIIDYFINHETKFNFYNVSSGKIIDLITLARKINAISPYRSKIIIRRKGLNKEYTASNTRLTKEIKGFKFTSIEEGISDLYKWYRKRLDLIDKKKIISQMVAENA